MKTVVFALIISCFVQNVAAQADFRPGYIVTLENDTLRGLIDLKGNYSNASLCRFKKGKSADLQTFSPEQISGYRYANGKFFVAKEVPGGEKFFLEYLINGQVDIYFLRSKNGDQYFIDPGNGVLRVLEGGDVDVEINGSRYKKKNTKYVSELKMAFAESPTIAQRSEKIKLGHGSLIRITKAYHQDVCEGETCIVYERETSPRQVSYGVSAAYATYLFNPDEFGDEDYYRYANLMDFGKDSYPAFGLFYRSNMPNLNHKLFFQWDILFASRSFGGKVETNEGTGWLERNTVSRMKFKHIGVTNMFVFGYEFPFGRLRPTLQAGGFVDLLTAGKFEYFHSEDYVLNLGGKEDFEKTDIIR